MAGPRKNLIDERFGDCPDLEREIKSVYSGDTFNLYEQDG
jgi:hypothetical protein